LGLRPALQDTYAAQYLGCISFKSLQVRKLCQF